MTEEEQLALLLQDHDGDDRCGCLGEALWQVAAVQQPISSAIAILYNCHVLGDHTSQPRRKSK